MCAGSYVCGSRSTSASTTRDAVARAMRPRTNTVLQLLRNEALTGSEIDGRERISRDLRDGHALYELGNECRATRRRGRAHLSV